MDPQYHKLPAGWELQLFAQFEAASSIPTDQEEQTSDDFGARQ